MDKAIRNVLKFSGESTGVYYVRFLQAIRDIAGANRMFKRIGSASSKEQIKDYLAEIRFALVFMGLEFNVDIEPLGVKGPDLRIYRDDHEALVEIIHFRNIFTGPPQFNFLDDAAAPQPYGNEARDIIKAYEKISDKFSQLGSKESIIAIWNDDGDMEEIEVENAVYNLWKDAAHNIGSLPSGLLFILYGSDWATLKGKQLYCFPVRNLNKPYKKWKDELESCDVYMIIEQMLPPPADLID